MTRFNKRKVFRILAGVLGVCLVISTAALAVMLITLPSVRQIVGESVPSIRPAPAPVAQAEVARVPASAPTPASRSRVDQAAMMNYLLNRFVNANTLEIRTCRLLTKPGANPSSSAEWKTALDRLATGEYRGDPILESMLLPAAFFVRLPAVRQALEIMRDALETGDSRFLDQPNFPTLLSEASSQIVRSQAALSQLSGRAYHLVTLARAVQMKPALANDERTTNLCTAMTNAAAADMRGQPALSLEEEKQALLSYLGFAGFSPEQLAYDPDMSHATSAVMTERQVSLSAPWFTRAMGIPFYIVAMQAMLPAAPVQ